MVKIGQRLKFTNPSYKDFGVFGHKCEVLNVNTDTCKVKALDGKNFQRSGSVYFLTVYASNWTILAGQEA